MARSTCAPRSCVFRSDSQVMTADLKEMLDEGKNFMRLHLNGWPRSWSASANRSWQR